MLKKMSWSVFPSAKTMPLSGIKKTGANKLPCDMLKIKDMVNRICASDQKGTIWAGLLRLILKGMIVKNGQMIKLNLAI